MQLVALHFGGAADDDDADADDQTAAVAVAAASARRGFGPTVVAGSYIYLFAY